MKKEQIIKWLTIMKVNLRAFPEISNSKKMQALGEAIKIIEQETVSKESYDHEYFLRKEFEIKIDELQRQLEEQAVKAESILDKIKEDVVQTRKMYLDMNDIDWLNGCDYVLSVVDKYKGEGEEKE